MGRQHQPGTEEQLSQASGQAAGRGQVRGASNTLAVISVLEAGGSHGRWSQGGGGMGRGKARPEVSVEGCTGGRGQLGACETARGHGGGRAVVQDKMKGVSRVQVVQALNARWAGPPWW